MKEKVFPADTAALDDVLGFAEEALEQAGCNTKMIMQLTVALEEIFVNVANYAYPKGNGSVRISIEFDNENNSVLFRIADKGIPFDPLAKPDPDITLSAEERQIGGLGIFICKMAMDEISYERKNDENILTMKKILK